MFDKFSLLQQLRELPFSEEEYWVVAGGAMVLHGIRPQTHDIDLGCSTRLADKLEQQGYAVSRCEDGTRKISYSEHVEIFENWIEGAVEIISGVPVVCMDGLIRMKKKLGREKDLADIALIEQVREASRLGNIRPLAKLSKAVKVADTGNQGKAESKALSAVTVTLREDTESFKKTDGVFNKDTFS